MLQKHIKVGGRYMARVGRNIVPVLVLRERSQYDARNHRERVELLKTLFAPFAGKPLPAWATDRLHAVLEQGEDLALEILVRENVPQLAPVARTILGRRGKTVL